MSAVVDDVAEDVRAITASRMYPQDYSCVRSLPLAIRDVVWAKRKARAFIGAMKRASVVALKRSPRTATIDEMSLIKNNRYVGRCAGLVKDAADDVTSARESARHVYETLTSFHHLPGQMARQFGILARHMGVPVVYRVGGECRIVSDNLHGTAVSPAQFKGERAYPVYINRIADGALVTEIWHADLLFRCEDTATLRCAMAVRRGEIPRVIHVEREHEMPVRDVDLSAAVMMYDGAIRVVPVLVKPPNKTPKLVYYAHAAGAPEIGYGSTRNQKIAALAALKRAVKAAMTATGG